MVEWLKCRDCDRHGFGLNFTRVILLKDTLRLLPLLDGWFSYISIKLKKQNKKFQPDSNIWASPEAGWGVIACPVYYRLRRFTPSQEVKFRDEIK